MRSDDEESVDGDLSCPEPAYLTPNGRVAYRDEVRAFARGVVDQLDRSAELALLHGRSPEHTADSVREACRAVKARNAAGVAPTNALRRRDEQRSLRGAIFVTAASVGSQASPGGLDTWWQVAVYVALMLVGAVGLVDVWRGRRASRRPRSDADEASGGGEMIDMS